VRYIYVSEFIESLFLLKYLLECYDIDLLSKRLGFAKTTIQQWEARKVRPSMEALQALRRLGDTALTEVQWQKAINASRRPVSYQDGFPVINI
jgi:transcriptional regulator with XRE-family HTH domain